QLKLGSAVAPTARGNDRGNPLIDAAGIHRYGRAEAVAGAGDAVRIHLGTRHQEGHGAPGVLDLLHADDVSARALALAATAHIEAERDVAPSGEQCRRADARLTALVAAEAVQHHAGGPALAGLQIVRHVQDPRQLQALRLKCDLFFHDASVSTAVPID